MFALVVRFEVLADHLSAFDSLVAETVAEIAANEHRTVVYATHLLSDRPNERVFYECYETEADFELHEDFDHTKRFLRERIQHLAIEPEVWRLTTGVGVIEGVGFGYPSSPRG